MLQKRGLLLPGLRELENQQKEKIQEIFVLWAGEKAATEREREREREVLFFSFGVGRKKQRGKNENECTPKISHEILRFFVVR